MGEKTNIRSLLFHNAFFLMLQRGADENAGFHCSIRRGRRSSRLRELCPEDVTKTTRSRNTHCQPTTNGPNYQRTFYDIIRHTGFRVLVDGNFLQLFVAVVDFAFFSSLNSFLCRSFPPIEYCISGNCFVKEEEEEEEEVVFVFGALNSASAWWVSTYSCRFTINPFATLLYVDALFIPLPPSPETTLRRLHLGVELGDADWTGNATSR
ncbi:hypothetical protein BV898_01841 [Hypsibius exemplaris]|uniref:Uncharacterized protein n=1 Tax=Hypsibius exemplaris TaxID=2072580 RepID=A0A1W0XAF5_HYPEX|nr:hypothetical protein BV898_01841 [Hypsibius exemplaris]